MYYNGEFLQQMGVKLTVTQRNAIQVQQKALLNVFRKEKYSGRLKTRGRFLVRYKNKSLKGFSPCYSQSPL